MMNHAATMDATNVSGTVVHLEPEVFSGLIQRIEQPLVIYTHTEGGWLVPESHQYLVGYEGLAFFTRAKQPIELPQEAEVIEAKAMSVGL